MIVCNSLCAFYGKKRVLDNLSFSLAQGEFVAVVGRNGCGKTTLLRSLLGSLPSITGEVLIDERPLRSYSSDAIARKISYLPQYMVSSPLTVLDTVLMGRLPHLGYPRIYRECDKVAAERAIEKMGLTSYRDTPVADLSGGYRQRVALACALATESKYLLLDEPSSFLDIESTLSLLSTLRNLAVEGRGVLAVLHDLPLALRFADRLIVIDDGHLIIDAPPDVLFSSGILDRVFGVRIDRTETPKGYAYFTV